MLCFQCLCSNIEYHMLICYLWKFVMYMLDAVINLQFYNFFHKMFDCSKIVFTFEVIPDVLKQAWMKIINNQGILF